MRALRSMTPTRADYFATSLRRERIAPSAHAKILDIGCGGKLLSTRSVHVDRGLISLLAGFVALAMAERNFTVVGIDPSENALQQARQECSKRTLVCLDGVEPPRVSISPRSTP